MKPIGLKMISLQVRGVGVRADLRGENVTASGLLLNPEVLRFEVSDLSAPDPRGSASCRTAVRLDLDDGRAPSDGLDEASTPEPARRAVHDVVELAFA